MTSENCYEMKCPFCNNEMSIHEKFGDPVKIIDYKCNNDKCSANRWQLLLANMKLVLISQKINLKSPG